MTAIYGISERQRLTGLANLIQAQNRPAWEELGTRIADILRAALPDLDDVTIGRVVVAIGVQLDILFTGKERDIRSLWAGLTAAGLQLTRPEWDDGTTGGI